MKQEFTIVIVAIMLALMVPMGMTGESKNSTIIANEAGVSELSFGIAATSDLVGKIAFYSDRDGDDEIYVMNADGTNVVQLTNNSDGDFWPAWSPDGSKIAFCSNRDGDREIYVMDADGTNVVQLTKNSDGDYWPAWSPDGSKIAFYSNRDGDREIYVMDADGTNVVQLTKNSDSDRCPAWSPDGSKIAFYSDRDGDDEIYVMNADGTNVVQLTKNSYSDYSPAWSPDGSKIAFYSYRDGDREIYVMDADGTNVVQLTKNSYSDYWPAWSPDGSKIAFNSDRDGDNEIYVMNADGTNVVQLTKNDAADKKPDWCCQVSSCPDADGDGVCDAEDNCPDDPGPVWNCGCPCPGGGVGDAVFIMDTSGSMDDEFSVLCSKIETVISDLQSLGINITYKIVGITENRDCTSDYVTNMVANPITDHEEDWGPATQDVAEKYSWRAGATRIIIPMSDEGPDDGCEITPDDQTSITNAIVSAKANNVRVSPVICSKTSQCTDAEHNTMVSLARQLASGTGGTFFTSSDPGSDLADGIRNLLGRGVCDRDGDGVPDGCDPYPDDPCLCGDEDGDGIDDCAKNCPCEPCVSIIVDVSINKNSYTPGDVFVYNVSVKNNQLSKGTKKSRIAISYGIIDPSPKTFIIGTRMPDIRLNDTYNFSGDFIVPDDVYSGKYLFFAAASDLETGCSGIDAEPYSIRLTEISKASKAAAGKNWQEIVEK